MSRKTAPISNVGVQSNEVNVSRVINRSWHVQELPGQKSDL